MQLQALALVRKRPVAQLLGIAVAAAFFLLSASTAKANLIGSYNVSTGTTGTVSMTSVPGPGPYSVGTTNAFSFCIDGNGCGSTGLDGFVTVTSTSVQFYFVGSTVSENGTFTIDLTGFGNRITGVTYGSGSLLAGSLGLTSFDGSSMLFTGSTSTLFYAVGGRTITFNVTSVPEVSSGILLFSILLPGLLLVAWRRKEIFGGSEA